jgi:aryl-alcohol dehydrogenase-like predicted oxidoreductase
MHQICLPGTAIFVSRFSFGTASLFNVGSRRQRYRLVEAAVTHGFTHFDTSPYYGFGTAERDLGAVLGDASGLTIATKVGLYPPGGADQREISVLARKIAGKAIRTLSRPLVDWTVRRARESLSSSLRRLKRDRVDLYLLHEPDGTVLRTDEWLRWLETEGDRVRHFGVAGPIGRVAPFADDALGTVIQTNDTVGGREADALLRRRRTLQLTYGYVSGAREAGRKMDVRAVLADALRRNTTGSVLVSTTSLKRLPQYAAVASETDTRSGWPDGS